MSWSIEVMLVVEVVLAVENSGGAQEVRVLQQSKSGVSGAKWRKKKHAKKQRHKNNNQHKNKELK